MSANVTIIFLLMSHVEFVLKIGFSKNVRNYHMEEQTEKFYVPTM